MLKWASCGGNKLPGETLYDWPHANTDSDMRRMARCDADDLPVVMENDACGEACSKRSSEAPTVVLARWIR
jgi:hypothetical protein